MESILTNLLTSIIGSVDNSINEAFSGLMDLCFNAEYTLTHNFGIAVASFDNLKTMITSFAICLIILKFLKRWQQVNNVLIVANFSAGRKQAIKYKKRIQKFLLVRQIYFRFINIDQLQEVDMDLFDTILVVGGDGTVNKVLPYLVNTNTTLGIIPCGTANLLASKLGINSIS